MKIALLAGDGIGPEVMDQAVKVVDAVAKKFGHTITYTAGKVGATAIDHTGLPTLMRPIRSVWMLTLYFLAPLAIPSMIMIPKPK